MSDETKKSGFDLRAYAIKDTHNVILHSGAGDHKLSGSLSLQDLGLSKADVAVLAHRLDRVLREMAEAKRKGPPPSGRVDIQTYG